LGFMAALNARTHKGTKFEVWKSISHASGGRSPQVHRPEYICGPRRGQRIGDLGFNFAAQVDKTELPGTKLKTVSCIALRMILRVAL